MWKPLLLVLSAMGLAALLVRGVERGAHFSAANGQPLDWAGDTLRCQRCSGVLKWQGGHRYLCQTCGGRCQAVYDSESGVHFSDSEEQTTERGSRHD